MNTTLSMSGDHPVLRFERHLSHSPEKVWKAVTDPAEMAHWFPATVHTEPKIGAAMRFSFENDLGLRETYAEGEILELDPPKVYAFRWIDTVIRFELIPEVTGCLLVFTPTLNGTDTTGDLPSVARNAPGWDGCLEALRAHLDGTTAPPHDESWFLHRAEHYIEKFGLAEGTVHSTGDGHLIRFERDLTPDPSTVWAALIDDEAEPTDNQPPPTRCTHGYLTPGTVTTLETGHTLEYTWKHDDKPAGRVHFELNEQDPIGCRFVLTQTLSADLSELRATMLAAWQTHLELFFAALHGDIRCPWPTDRTEQLTQHYARRLDSTD